MSRETKAQIQANLQAEFSLRNQIQEELTKVRDSQATLRARVASLEAQLKDKNSTSWRIEAAIPTTKQSPNVKANAAIVLSLKDRDVASLTALKGGENGRGPWVMVPSQKRYPKAVKCSCGKEVEVKPEGKEFRFLGLEPQFEKSLARAIMERVDCDQLQERYSVRFNKLD